MSAAQSFDLEERIRSTLEANRVTAENGRYTKPARGTYPHQWLWDSCFHARIWVLLGDEARARDELRALFREQVRSGPDAGRVPHMTFLGGHSSEAAEDPDARAAYERDVALFGDPRASTITQPPIIAETVELVADHDFWRELWQPLTAYYDWWIRRRSPRGDHLYASWHVWECGADATPRCDVPCRRVLATGRVPRTLAQQTINPTAKKRRDMLVARFSMMEELAAIDGDEAEGRLPEAQAQRRRLALFGHVGVDMQAYLVRNFGALARIADALGEDGSRTRYRAEADAIVEAVNATMWDEERGFYFDHFGEPAEVAAVFTHAPFIALYADDLVPEERALRLLHHLLDPQAFWTRWPVPTTARFEPSFDPDAYWRGSTWINVNWLVVRGLLSAARRFGDPRYLEPARVVAQRSVEAVRAAKLREYYRSGALRPERDGAVEPAGFGPGDFSWSALVLDLARLLEGELS